MIKAFSAHYMTRGNSVLRLKVPEKALGANNVVIGAPKTKTKSLAASRVNSNEK